MRPTPAPVAPSAARPVVPAVTGRAVTPATVVRDTANTASTRPGSLHHGPAHLALRAAHAARDYNLALAMLIGLTGGPAKDQYVALVTPTPTGLSGFDRVSFRASADHPLRLSLQIRASDRTGKRWRRSVYVDQSPVDVQIRFGDMRRVGDRAPGAPDLSKIEALLVVVDLTNSRPSAAGRVTIESPRLERVASEVRSER